MCTFVYTCNKRTCTRARAPSLSLSRTPRVYYLALAGCLLIFDDLLYNILFLLCVCVCVCVL